MDSGPPRFADSPDEFARYLRDLKRKGCNLLITGDVPGAVTARATRTLFGRGGRRYRVLALLDTASRIPESLAVDDDRLWVVERADKKRSVPSNAPRRELAGKTDDLSAIRREIVAATDFYDETAGGLDPAELRVGVDLRGETDRRRVRQFVEETTALVTDARGMGHYHLSIPDDDPFVGALSPLFDARIELRQIPGRPPEQRWHIPSLDKTTIWVQL